MIRGQTVPLSSPQPNNKQRLACRTTFPYAARGLRLLLQERFPETPQQRARNYGQTDHPENRPGESVWLNISVDYHTNKCGVSLLIAVRLSDHPRCRATASGT